LSLQDPLAVDHSGNHNLALLQSIDDPIAVDEQLAYIFVVKLRTFRPERGKSDNDLVWFTTFLTTMPAYVGESAAI